MPPADGDTLAAAQPQQPGGLPAGVEGAAFPLAVKVLATALVAALAHWGWLAWDDLAAAGLPGGAVAVLGLALACIVLCYGAMLRSRTRVDATHIRQSWLWRKEVALADITQLKFIHLPGLAWLVVPRLVVRVRGRGLYTFHAGDPRVQQVFALLSHGRAPGSDEIPTPTPKP